MSRDETPSGQVRIALSQIGGEYFIEKSDPNFSKIQSAVWRLRKVKGFVITERYEDEAITFTTVDQVAPEPKKETAKRKAKTARHPELGATLKVTTLGLDDNGEIIVGFSDGWVARLV